MTMLTRRHLTSKPPLTGRKNSFLHQKNRMSTTNNNTATTTTTTTTTTTATTTISKSNNKRIVRYSTSFRKNYNSLKANATLRLRLKHRSYMHKKKVTKSEDTNYLLDINSKRVKKIRFGRFTIDTWFVSPYPPEYCNLPMLYICEFCFKYMRTASIARRHKYKCHQRHPPGDEIYRQGNVSVFEVDGRKNKMYCLNLCLLTKMFLDHKTLFYDVEPFLFYILTETDEKGCHFVGYFSKEKKSALGYNVSCILILPIYQRKGYGQYLIDFSYLLTKEEKTVGSPEKPLSNLGAMSYQKYWKYTLYHYFISNDNDTMDKISIQDLSHQTGMTPDDVVATLHQEQILVMHNNHLVLNIDKERMRAELEKEKKKKKMLSIDPSKLKWSPYTLSQERLSRLLENQ